MYKPMLYYSLSFFPAIGDTTSPVVLA